jgi:NADH-quinone oxidoreductase subunit N
VNGLVTLDWLVLAPVLAPAAGAVAVLLFDALLPRWSGASSLVGVVFLALGMALTAPGIASSSSEPLRTLCLPAPDGACLYEAGPLASALQLAALGAALVVLLLIWPTAGSQALLRGGPAVIVSLVLAATTGAVGVAAAHDLGSWLVCIELATLPAIGLVALRGTPAAGRGALALLTTSLVSFALLALGAALWLTATHEAIFARGGVEAAFGDADRRPVMLLGVLLLVAGLGFKLSLVPFHVWTPQAYAGGSDTVAAFLAGTSKVAALAALVVVLHPLADAGAPVLVAIGILAAVSMTVGNVIALVQDDPVRLLAWSTVAQAGWVVLPLSALDPRSASAAGGYLLAYVVATLVAFCVVHIMGSAPQGPGAGSDESTRPRLAAYTGLLRSHPFLGGALGLALLALAGLPPGIIGLVAKVLALQPVVAGQQWLLAGIAAANAVLGIAVYLRWFAVLLRDPDTAAERPAVPVLRGVARPAIVALGLTTTALVVTSVLPQLLLGFVE